MIRILMNIKGGVGKTTTAINMGVGFSDLNKRTLLVDLDGQANSTFIILGKKIDKDQLSVAEAILDPSKTKDAILKTQYENLDILPSKLSLFNSERHVLMDVSGGQSAKVQKMLKQVEDQYDEIIIDCNPSRGILNTNAVYACKGFKGEVIIPILIDINAVDGFVNTVNFINEINEATDSDIEWKVLFTMFNRTKKNAEVYEDITKLVGNKVFDTRIRYQNAPITRAGYDGTVVIRNTKVGVGSDYSEFVNELANKE